MTIAFSCTCGKQLRAPESCIGLQSKCPACGVQVLVPAAVADDPAPEPTQAVTAPAPAPASPVPAAAAPADLKMVGEVPSWQKHLPLASLVCGAASFCLPFLLAAPALVCGFLGLRIIRQSDGAVKGKGLALAGIGLGLASTAVAGIVLIVYPVIGAIVTIAFQYYLLAFTAMVIGVINLAGGFKPSLSWGGSLLGLVQVILGIFLVTHPIVGMLAYVPTLGIIVMAGGIAAIIAAFRVKRAMAAAA